MQTALERKTVGRMCMSICQLLVEAVPKACAESFEVPWLQLSRLNVYMERVPAGLCTACSDTYADQNIGNWSSLVTAHAERPRCSVYSLWAISLQYVQLPPGTQRLANTFFQHYVSLIADINPTNEY